MKSIQKEIKDMSGSELNEILQLVISRYRVLYPDWELSVISLEKDRDKTAQLNRIIAALESMKQV